MVWQYYGPRKFSKINKAIYIFEKINKGHNFHNGKKIS